MIQDDRRIWKSPRQIRQRWNLWVIAPGFEQEALLFELHEKSCASPETREVLVLMDQLDEGVEDLRCPELRRQRAQLLESARALIDQ